MVSQGEIKASIMVILEERLTTESINKLEKDGYFVRDWFYDFSDVSPKEAAKRIEEEYNGEQPDSDGELTRK